MSDIKVIRYLLANSPALNELVQPDRIMAGMVPQGTPLPAIEITHVSGIWNNEVSEQSKTCRARVQITVIAQSYTQQKEVIRLVRGAVPRSRGTIAGVSVDSILREPDGPDFRDDDVGLFMQTQDFIVTYNE